MRSKIPNTKTSIFTIMSRLSNEQGAINLAQGFPNFPSSPKLLSLVSKYVDQGYNQYAPMAGVQVLREKLSEKIASLYKYAPEPESEITITAGATQALFTAITAFVHMGDEVIVLEPCYDSYIPAIKLNGARPVSIPLNSPNYDIPWDKVKAAISDKTRMLIINTPHNPTGAIISKKDVKELEEIVSKHKILVLSDEVYEHITFETRAHESLLASDILRPYSLVCFSFGKVLHTTGWKLGYIVANKDLSDEFRKVHQFNVFSCNTPIQYAIAEFLDEKEYLELPSFFEAKRDLLLEALKSSRFNAIPASGTYFQLLDYSTISEEGDFDFAQRITREKKVASIPVSSFYSDLKDDKMIRLCFAKTDDTIKRAADILVNI